MELICETKCFLCVRELHFDELQCCVFYGIQAKFQQLLRYISADSESEDCHGNFCYNCQELLKTFCEQQNEPKMARERVRDICLVMEGVKSGVMREHVKNKGLSLLEKPHLPRIDQEQLPMGSGSGSGQEKEPTSRRKASTGKRGRPLLPLPDFIKKTTGMEKQPYHCLICKKDLPSDRLTQHRRHGKKRNASKKSSSSSAMTPLPFSTSASSPNETSAGISHPPSKSTQSRGSPNSDSDVITLKRRQGKVKGRYDYYQYCTLCKVKVTNSWQHRNTQQHQDRLA